MFKATPRATRVSSVQRITVETDPELGPANSNAQVPEKRIGGGSTPQEGSSMNMGTASDEFRKLVARGTRTTACAVVRARERIEWPETAGICTTSLISSSPSLSSHPRSWRHHCRASSLPTREPQRS
eukprot:6211014-Pleurochrysis_carterae.AAC.1